MRRDAIALLVLSWVCLGAANAIGFFDVGDIGESRDALQSIFSLWTFALLGCWMYVMFSDRRAQQKKKGACQ